MTAAGGDLTELLRQRVREDPDSVLISGARHSSTASSVLELVDAKIARYREAGVGVNSRVGMLGWPGLDFVTDLFAVFALGAAAAPLPKSASKWELNGYQAQAGLTHLAAPVASGLGLGQDRFEVGTPVVRPRSPRYRRCSGWSLPTPETGKVLRPKQRI